MEDWRGWRVDQYYPSHKDLDELVHFHCLCQFCNIALSPLIVASLTSIVLEKGPPEDFFDEADQAPTIENGTPTQNENEIVSAVICAGNQIEGIEFIQNQLLLLTMIMNLPLRMFQIVKLYSPDFVTVKSMAMMAQINKQHKFPLTTNQISKRDGMQ